MAGASLPPPKRLIYQQQTAATIWTIQHGFGYFPNVVVTDSAGNVVEGDIQNTSVNAVVLTFGAAFSGEASLS